MKNFFLALCLSLFSLSAIAMPIPELVFGAAMSKYSLQLFAERAQTNPANFMVSPFSPYQKLLGCQCESHDALDCHGALHLAKTVLRGSLAKASLTVKTSTAIAIAKPLSDPHLMILFIASRSGVNFNDLKRQLDFKTYEFYIEHLHARAAVMWPPSPPYIVIIYDKTNDGIAYIGQITQLNNE